MIGTATPAARGRAGRMTLAAWLLLLVFGPWLGPQRPFQPRLAYQVDLPAPLRTAEALDLQGEWLAVASEDEVRVLEAASGRPLTVLPCAGASHCRFLKNRLMVAGREGVDLYATPGFKKLWRYSFPVEFATASTDGSLVVVAQNRPREQNLTVAMLTAQGNLLWTFNGRGMSLASLDAGSDGRHLIIHWNEPKDQFWLYNPWQRRFIVDAAGRGALQAGNLAQLARGRLRVVDLDRGLLTGPVDCPDAPLSFSPDGERLLTGAQVWRTEDLAREGRSPAPGAAHSRFLGSREAVVSWTPAGEATVWDSSSGQPVTSRFEVVAQPLAVVGQGRRLAGAGARLLRVWEW